jgi:hypothetical protein
MFFSDSSAWLTMTIKRHLMNHKSCINTIFSSFFLKKRKESCSYYYLPALMTVELNILDI